MTKTAAASEPLDDDAVPAPDEEAASEPEPAEEIDALESEKAAEFLKKAASATDMAAYLETLRRIGDVLTREEEFLLAKRIQASLIECAKDVRGLLEMAEDRLLGPPRRGRRPARLSEAVSLYERLRTEDIDWRDDRALWEYVRDRACEFLGWYGRPGAIDDLDLMVAKNLRLVVSIARKVRRPAGATLLDAVQEGNIGLIKGICRFDPDRGFKLSTYASWWIRHAISRTFDNSGSTVRLPVHQRDFLRKAGHAETVLTNELCRQPTEAEIARRMLNKERLAKLLGHQPTRREVNVWVVKAAAKLRKLKALGTEKTVSLDSPMSSEGPVTYLQAMQAEPDPNGDPLKNLESEHGQRLLAECLAKLPDREQDILRQRFGLETDETLTLAEIGQKYGISRERIRQLEEQAKAKLRRILFIRGYDPRP